MTYLLDLFLLLAPLSFRKFFFSIRIWPYPICLPYAYLCSHFVYHAAHALFLSILQPCAPASFLPCTFRSLYLCNNSSHLSSHLPSRRVRFLPVHSDGHFFLTLIILLLQCWHSVSVVFSQLTPALWKTYVTSLCSLLSPQNLAGFMLYSRCSININWINPPSPFHRSQNWVPLRVNKSLKVHSWLGAELEFKATPPHSRVTAPSGSPIPS